MGFIKINTTAKSKSKRKEYVAEVKEPPKENIIILRLQGLLVLLQGILYILKNIKKGEDNINLLAAREELQCAGTLILRSIHSFELYQKDMIKGRKEE